MKKHGWHLLTVCVVVFGITAVHTGTAYAARCPEGGVVSSFDVEMTPELKCLEVEMVGGCMSVDLQIRNRCDETVTLRQTEEGCRANNDKLGDRAQVVIADCVTEKLEPDSVDGAGKSYAMWGIPARAEDKEIVLEGTHGDAPLRVKVTYSATIVPYPTSSCGCSSLNQTTPLAPLSLLGTLALAGTLIVRSRRRQ